MKSGKLVPVHFSSRHWDFKRSKWAFGKSSDEEVLRLLERKVYWETRLTGTKVWLGDPTEAMYVESSLEHLLLLAQKLQEQGLLKLEGEWAAATPQLMAQAEKFEGDLRAALEELEKKHAFERG